jgi:DNA-binding transcriptional LysR family regulator
MIAARSMQIETCKIFCDLAETHSFSKAAELNDITQSAVSQQIRALETKFEVTLIERGRRSFALTSEGRAFLEACRKILEIYDGLADKLHELRDVIAGRLKICAIYSIGLHELPPFVRQFRRRHPEVDVSVDYRRSAQVYAAVLSGEADFGFVSFPAKRNGLQVEPFVRDRMVVICPPSHRLAARKRIPVEELEGEPFIAFEPDQPTRKEIDRHLKEHGVAVKRAMEFDNVETVKRAVEIGDGISIVPEKTVQQEVESGVLRVVQLEKSELWRPLGIVSKRHRSRTPAQREFLELLRGPGRERDETPAD